MSRYNVLILTDHSSHSDQNSIYALAKTMKAHPRCSSVWVASRGLSENASFYQDQIADELYGAEVMSDFAHSADGHYFKRGLTRLNREDFQIVFMRLPRPISDEFLFWVEDVFADTAVIINRPSGIAITSSKKFLLNVESHCPPMRYCQSVDEIMYFSQQMDIVLKPLKEYGGKGILKISQNQLDDGSAIHDKESYLRAMESTIIQDGYLAMKYLKNVHRGDKRILVANGVPLAASTRYPAKGSWLCNVAQGGTSRVDYVTEEEREMIASISPLLLEYGILIYGADTLVDDDGKRVLSEINTLSIGGFAQAEAQTSKPILKTTINAMIEYADEHYV